LDEQETFWPDVSVGDGRRLLIYKSG